MANVMRWRYGDTNPVKVPVLSDDEVAIGDLVLLDTDGNICPPRNLAPTGLDHEHREAAKRVFLGVAMQASMRGEMNDIRVATSGCFEYDTGDEVPLGKRVSFVTRDRVLQAQRVAFTHEAAQSIGKATRPGKSGKVLIAIHSQVFKHD